MTNRFAIAEDYGDAVPDEFREAVLNNPDLAFLVSDHLKSEDKWSYYELPETIPRHHPELLRIIEDLTTLKVEHNWKIIETKHDRYVVYRSNFNNNESFKVTGVNSFSDELPTPPEPEGSHILSEVQKQLLNNCHEALVKVINDYSLALSQQAAANLLNQLRSMLEPDVWGAETIPGELPNVDSFTCMINYLSTTLLHRPTMPGLGFSVKGNVIVSWVTRYLPTHKTIIEFLPDFTAKWSISHSNDIGQINSMATGTELVSNLNKVLLGFQK